MISEKILVKRNGFNNESNAFEYSNLARFRWYNYKEGFSNRLVEEAIGSVEFNKEDYVLDPFNGNGTVTLTAAMKNIPSIGIEVNPFSAFMASAKMATSNGKDFLSEKNKTIQSIIDGKTSDLLNFSTFTEFSKRKKWLFNSSVLKGFDGGWTVSKSFSKENRDLYKLALIGAALDNCNAVKDGKCLKYRHNWANRQFDKDTFLKSFEKRIGIIAEDLNNTEVRANAQIINGDARVQIEKLTSKFKLCITSPPYLNSFDYTDIYRPELFLGRFIKDNAELNYLRYQTLRSHVEIKLPSAANEDLGLIYATVKSEITRVPYLWDKQIPLMIQSYFEDLKVVLQALKNKARMEAEIWFVVANSIYGGVEIPVDLILADIGTRLGLRLVKIEVLRNIQRRKTKYNGDKTLLRESLIVFKNI